MPRPSKKNERRNNGANLGFEEKLWQAADKMRGHMDPSEYKHIVLGLISLKYISDAFKERRDFLVRETAAPKSEYYVKNAAERDRVAEERDEYTAENIFWVPKAARWTYLQDRAKEPTIGKLLDDAMTVIEKVSMEMSRLTPE
ncbi:MAG TPA: type I restriction-modification system subunit M N-terminal domain-containing protein [Elusimicrobiota bacterium]|nr:type I restriction-modification system subunit M N-terminal domain-containing protein [Elusimicrobiota bacterium]